jgi:DNA integrity scanning protein DisA with diadenylate cyclase activity
MLLYVRMRSYLQIHRYVNNATNIVPTWLYIYETKKIYKWEHLLQVSKVILHFLILNKLEVIYFDIDMQ